jgi:glycosyltransferase involved in cell wall biosynthesis
MVILGIFLNNEIRTGGNRRYLELMELLAERGSRVYVIMNTYLKYDPLCFSRIDLRVKYRSGGFPRASFLFKRTIKKNADLIKARLEAGGRGGPDVIHIHSGMHLPSAVFLKRHFHTRLFFAFRANDILLARIVRGTGELTKKEFILSLIYEQVNRMREKQAAREASLVTFQNTADRDDFVSRTAYPAAHTVIIPGNIGPPRFTPQWANKNNSASVGKLLYVGVLSVSKGLQYLLKAVAILKDRGRASIRLIVLGDLGGAGPVFKLVESLGIKEQVQFVGFALPFPYLASCDLFVYPTLYDAFPDTVLEALHTGCPVIASETGGIPELLKNRELLFPPGDSDEIARRIQRCVDSPDYYRHIRDLCGERAGAYRFDWALAFEEAIHTIVS